MRRAALVHSVSVVIRCFNEEEHLGNLLQAVAVQEGVRPESSPSGTIGCYRC